MNGGREWIPRMKQENGVKSRSRDVHCIFEILFILHQMREKSLNPSTLGSSLQHWFSLILFENEWNHHTSIVHQLILPDPARVLPEL